MTRAGYVWGASEAEPGRTGPRSPIRIRPWGSFWPDSDNVADKELEDHAEAERTMKELESLDADEPGYDLLIGELVTGIRSHIRDEEDYLFPPAAADGI
ncbi:hypothetical protein [Streptomyces sp. NBC_00728]|uniref:hypothetical protein n=1 Tax=Streptomyces sp. NBC_00728 TaxID=2903676 RepID=UPI00386B3F97